MMGQLEESGMDWFFTDKDPKDEIAKRMAFTAIEFAMHNNISLSYQENVCGLSFFFPRKGVVSRYTTYLNWENREELFTKMMAEAKELI